MQNQRRCAHGARPDGAQSQQHQFSVCDGRHCAGEASGHAENCALSEKQLADIVGRKSQRLERTHFAQALLDAKLEK